MKIRIIFILSAFIFACGTVKLSIPVQADVDRGTAKFPGLTIEDLYKGKLIYEQACVKCHAMKNPTSRSEDKWRKIVPKMVLKANKKAGKELIDSNNREVLLKYLVTMSSLKSK